MINSNNRLGTKLSKEKTRPKSSERIKQSKQKSVTEVVEEAPIAEVPEPCPVKDSSDDEFKEFRIIPDNFKSKHFPKPPSEKLKTTIRIRKNVLPQAIEKQKPKNKVLVAKPVPTDDIKDGTEPTPHAMVNKTSDNIIKPYNILGSLEEFQKQSLLHKVNVDVQVAEDTFPCQENNRVQTKTESPKNSKPCADETNALKNWQKHMNDSKKQQEKLSKRMAVSKDMLVMNQSDTFRSVQEERTLIDRAMPTKDYGKGYRVGSEFWKQAEAIGNDDGISITLNQTERGLVPPIEHIGHPSHIREEMGMGNTSRLQNVPWWNSSYLHERREHLQDVIDEMDPHMPYIAGLEIIGKSLAQQPASTLDEENESESEDTDFVADENKDDELEEQDTPVPSFSPSLIINGQTATWQGEPTANLSKDAVGMTVRLLFENKTGTSSQQSMNVTNDGTAPIYYQWKRKAQVNTFGTERTIPIMRFYFDIDDGVILPGITSSLPFFFKSPNVGIFTETWELCTQPVLCGGEKIEIVLRGIATEEDWFENEREQIDTMLQVRQNKRMVERLLRDVLSGVQTPPRPSTPTNAYITEEELFNMKNKNVRYKTSTVNNLKSFYEELKEGEEWDLSIATLRENVLAISEEEEKEDALRTLNDRLSELCLETRCPIGKNDYDTCYEIMCETVDKFVQNAIKLRMKMGLPEKELVIKSEEVPKKGKKSNIEAKQPRVDSRSKKDSPVGKNKTPRNVDASGINGGKAGGDVVMVKENRAAFLNDPAYKTYMNKMYMQVYNCLSEMANSIDKLLTEDQALI